MHRALLRQLRNWGRLGDASDAQLLREFIATRDEAAFAQLVHLHGPVVLGVCRRMLTRSQDVEDAFQATFLVLARKGRSLRPDTPLGAWLHGVAWRTAKKAQTMNAKHGSRVRGYVPETASAAAPVFEQADLRQVIDEEISRLSAEQQAVVVACLLEERSECPRGRPGCPCNPACRH